MNQVRSFILVKTLQGLAQSWFATSYVLFVLSFGHELWQVNLLNVLFMGTIFVIDPLTGAIGDKWGYKRIYILGCLLWALGDVVYFMSSSYVFFLLAEFCAALGFAAESEALESSLDNALPHDVANKARAQAESGKYFASIAGGVIGSFIAGQFGLQWPWLLAALSHVIVAILAYHTFPQDIPHKENAEVNFMRQVVAGGKFTFTHKHIWFIAVLGFITAAAYQALNMFWAPRLTELGMSEWQLGFVWAGISIGLGFGAYLSGKLKNAKQRYFSYLLMWVVGMIVIAGLTQNYFLVALAFVMHELPRGAWRNFAYGYVNKHIPPHQKSTVNSFRSALTTGGAALGLLLSGWLSNYFSIAEAWLVSAACLAVLSIWVWLQKD